MNEQSFSQFARLELRDWRQFSSVQIAFHPQLTVLTGANGTGKTTLLNILGRHFNGWTQLLGVPRLNVAGDIVWSIDSREDTSGNGRAIGNITYDSPAGLITSPLQANPSTTYELEIPSQQQVMGVAIPSHRQVPVYLGLSSLPTRFSPVRDILDQYLSEVRNRTGGNYSARAPISYMKEALITAGLYGPGNAVVEPDPRAMQVWDGYQEVLTRVLPPSLGFERLRVRLPDLLLQTKSGDEFLLEAMSGGISAIMELSWQIFLRSREFTRFTVCIDEPENHLHPSLQRSLIPGLLDAFPNITFVVATHSPHIVTSVPDSNVYALDYADTRVESRLLDYASKAASADATLRRVLGLETTIPLWVEKRLADVLSDFPTEAAGPEDLQRLREAMTAAGLRDEFPAAVDSLDRRAGDADAASN